MHCLVCCRTYRDSRDHSRKARSCTQVNLLRKTGVWVNHREHEEVPTVASADSQVVVKVGCLKSPDGARRCLDPDTIAKQLEARKFDFHLVRRVSIR
eukprot:CAMPEP_0119205746 /NCGR_PEP_ID=MMETSP1316-20130426/40042_1 /TAXON_ID=41880 /ORGANISM="Pycnococcus provasolii, Strain RCC2336" /LENGTH=96 /DNA_ID=CAMNT_0007202139 /DNA_START=90 /DNA_END=380 /DNA_ORIENTATION=-